MSSNNKINCPICHSKNIAEYLYGMPAFSKKLEKQLANKKVILGGCCIDEHSPTYHCNDCGQEWSDIEDKKWELVEGKVDTAEDHFKIRYGELNFDKILSGDFIKELHYKMFGNVWRWLVLLEIQIKILA